MYLCGENILKKIFLLNLLLILTVARLFSQAPQKFYTRFGGNGYDVGYDVKQTFDKGYIITGSTSSFGQGNTDMYLVKLDSMGNKTFETTFGNYNNEIGKSVLQLADSSYVMVGYTNSTGFGGYDIFLVKADKNGTLVWQKTIGGSDWDFANSLQQTNDGGFIIGGTTYSYGRGNADGYVVKTDASGNVSWSKTFGGANDDEFKSVIQTADMGYALTGYTKSYNDIDSGDVWVFKLNSLGDSTWCKFYGGGQEDFGNSIIQLQSLDFIFSGGTRSTSVAGNRETFFTRVNSLNGSQISSYIDLSSVNEYYNDIEQGNNGYIVACGSTHSLLYNYDAVVDIYNSSFNYFNAYSIGDNSDDELFAVNKTRDKGYALVGVTNGYGAVHQDVFFIKIDSLGNYGNSITSIDESSVYNNKDMEIFPNPCSDFININLHEKGKNNDFSFKILNLNGIEVSNGLITDDMSSISLPTLLSGLYFLQIYYKSNLKNCLKISIIKQ